MSVRVTASRGRSSIRRVFETLTVGENLLIGAENRSRSVTVREILGIGGAEVRARAALVERVLADTKLTGLRDVRAGQLPTGTLRNVELARALCMCPKVMLLDEPASGLDDVEVGRLRQQLAAQAARGLTVVLIEHDISLVGASADRRLCDGGWTGDCEWSVRRGARPSRRTCRGIGTHRMTTMIASRS